MSKFWIVFKREYTQVVKKKSFLIGIFVMPLFMGGIMLLPAYLATRDSDEAEQLAVIDISGSGMGSAFAESLDQYTLKDTGDPYYNVHNVFELATSDTATFALIDDSLKELINSNALKYYLVIKADAHLIDSNVYIVTNSSSFKSFSRFEGRLADILSTERIKMTDIDLTVDSILNITRRSDLIIRDATGESIPFEVSYFAALILVMLMFGMIIAYGQMVMRSIIEEKNSRIMEVLISSVSPFQLLLGKVLGLGAATFTQILVWMAMGAIIYTQKSTLEISSAIDRIIFNPYIVVFFVLYWIFGYVLMTTLFALIGSIVNTEKEAQGFVAPITISLMLPVILGIYVIQHPNSTIVTVLSLIPFLTPTLMVMRLVFIVPTLTDLSMTSGIIVQASIGLVLVILTMFGMVWLCSKIFRVGILMYGKRPTLPEIIRWVRY